MVEQVHLLRAAPKDRLGRQLQSEHLALVALSIFTTLLFLYRRLVLLVMQGLAYAAAASWLALTARIVETRLQGGQPFKLAALILSGVAPLTLLAGVMLTSRLVRQHSPNKRDAAKASRARRVGHLMLNLFGTARCSPAPLGPSRQHRCRTPLVHQMRDCHDRVAQHHPGACPAHHKTDPLAHIGLVAMNKAVAAGRLGVAEHASLQAPLCVFEQRFAVATKTIGVDVVVSPAIHAHHGIDGFERASAAHESFVNRNFHGLHGMCQHAPSTR